jgi:NAD(P)-dependent dehydrogenase (short-subunit alcohol dehydrogenase family)
MVDISSTKGELQMSLFNFPKGSVALVTGAGSGIGFATASLLSQMGVVTYGLTKKSEDKPEDSNDLIRWLSADVSDRDEVENALSAIREDHENLDFLVSNAAVVRHASVGDVLISDLKYMIDTNLIGFFNVIGAALPMLRKSNSASVVAVSSIHAQTTSRMVSGYAATKGALVSAVKASALDLGMDGIRVNAILPGSVDTPMLRASAIVRSPENPQKQVDEWGSHHPLGRILEPEEVANAIIFLGSPMASGITGATLIVDGGLSAKLAL